MVETPFVTETAFLPDALAAIGQGTSLRQWLSERAASHDFQVSRVPLAQLERWSIEPGTGNIVHDSGRFFKIEGLRVRTDQDGVREWDQPIIDQPEIGLLGLLVRRIHGELHCLLQAKMEPGNVNILQLSPTVQATRSNYSRVHHGTSIRYLEYFARPRRGTVLVDVLQSEHGAWFLRKRNRNMVIEIDEDLPLEPDFCWVPLADARALLSVDNLVNMDVRSVISCLGALGRRTGSGDAFSAALDHSYITRGARRDIDDILSWFTELKALHDVSSRTVPLASVTGWRRTEREIAHQHGRHFSVIGVAVRAGSREVAAWSQPLLEPHGHGVVAFLMKRFGGVLHLLVRARVEAGYLDVVELGPTVQCVPRNHPGETPPFLDEVSGADPSSVRFSAILSEEGGRFYHAQSRYSLIEAGDDFPETVPADFCWMTAGQLTGLLKHNNYVNVQARTLLSALASLGEAREVR
jgi:oxidase EvaA